MAWSVFNCHFLMQSKQYLVRKVNTLGASYSVCTKLAILRNGENPANKITLFSR